MNRLVSEPLSAESVILAALPILEAVGALLAIIAILTLVIAILHIILEARSSDLHAQSCLFNTMSGRIRPFPVDAGGAARLNTTPRIWRPRSARMSAILPWRTS